MNNQSESINELASALSKAQGEMQAAIKDSINPFFKSKYADLGSVWDAARPVLSKHGLCVIQATEIINDKIIMVTTLAHSSGQWIKSYLPLNPAKNDSQGVGAAITYLRRYSLSALVGVVCDDDDDGETAVGRNKNQNQPKPVKWVDIPIITAVQAHELDKILCQLSNEVRENVCKAYEIAQVSMLPLEHYEQVLKRLNRTLELKKQNEANQ